MSFPEDFPQLRVRTGYSFRNVYGRHDEVFARLAELGCTTAAIVDMGTWGHARYEQAAKKAGVQPIFGAEIPILTFAPDGESFEKHKPVAWMLGACMRAFYTASSECVRGKGLTADEFGALEGCIRFPGGAIDLLHPDDYDYIDINPASILQAHININVARQTGKPIVITAYNDMPRESDKSFAYAWEVRDSVGMRHIPTLSELWAELQCVLTRAEFDAGVANAFKIAASMQGMSLPKAPLIHLDGDLMALCREGQEYRVSKGHIESWDEIYEARLHEEIEQIANKKFESYFFVVADLIRFAKLHMLVGPARGSSAGSLVCYLMGITEVDPLPHKLIFQRFIDVTRADLPDIDIDFADTKRYMVFDYLKEKYGAANVAKLGNINTLKAASVMAQVGKQFNIPIHDNMSVRNALIEYSSGDERYGKGLQDTFDTTAPGREFAARYVEASKCMGDLELHPSHSGVHAAGIIVCNDAITDYCTVNEEGIAQIDKPDSEYLNLLKIDALGLRTLGIIDDSGVTSSEELYALKLDDPEVFKILGDDKVSGIFQFEGDAVRSATRMLHVVDRFSLIDNITALARPGPLSSGMAVKFIHRANGDEAITYDVPELEKYLGETFGVFLYQEQIMSVVKEIGQFDWAKTSAIRKAISGRKGEAFFNTMGEDFVDGAIRSGVPEDKARIIWKEMVTFGAWGFNKSHSVSYAVVTYWTCWMKRYHKLPFAAACLRAAKDDDQTIAILRELAKEGVEYTPIDPEFSDLNWKVADGRLIGGILNAKGYGPAKALAYVEKRAAGLLTDKDRERLATAEVQFSDLAEAHTKWGHYYKNPRLAGVLDGSDIVGMKTVNGRENCLCIGKLVKKVLADENEPIRVKKRGGTMFKGQSQFIDLMMLDDSTDGAFRFRIRPNLYMEMGLDIAETAPMGSWFLIRGWKIDGIDMMIVKKIKRIA